MRIVPGQRWISSAEPDLGVGTVVSADGRLATLRFDRAGETRTFRVANAPISRYRLGKGDSARIASGTVAVSGVEERDGLLWYLFDGGEFPETDLLDAASGSSGASGSFADALLDGSFGTVEDFELRAQANDLRSKIAGDPARGFVGPDIDLYEHQLQIADAACSEARLPRRLLSDEVGLGKTIEAGLIFHRLLKTGRVRRALIVVPQALRHQWMAEMYRRFHVTFTLVDDDYCQQLEASREARRDDADLLGRTGVSALKSAVGVGEVRKDSVNPFLQSDFQIVDQDWLLIPGRREQLAKARFDLAIVDEAHTISPDPEHRALYDILRDLARVTPGLLLLTATPVQLRLDAHFARLKLLDPARYPDFGKWKTEYARYSEIAAKLGGLVERMEDPDAPWSTMLGALKKEPALRDLAGAVPEPDKTSCARALRFLCDAMGTGRAVVRNTRRSVGGFFKRRLSRHPLKRDAAYWKKCLPLADDVGLDESERFWFLQNGAVFFDRRWFEEERQKELAKLLARDEKIRWLVKFLKKRAGEKVLVLCGSEYTALSVQLALRALAGLDAAIFFEQMGESYLRDDASAPAAARSGLQFVRSDEEPDADDDGRDDFDDDEEFSAAADSLFAAAGDDLPAGESAEARRVRLDSAAAAFADPDGPDVLVSSEIGSEGRNFQCAHVLVLFDLPDEPGKLEQRIGRVDRVGQTKDVEIHVPYVEGTLGERLCDWYDRALDVFVRPVMGIETVHSARRAELAAFLERPGEDSEKFLDEFVPRVREEADALRRSAHEGRDLLLEFNSFDPREAKRVKADVLRAEKENAAENFVIDVMERFGAEISRGAVPGTWVVRPGEGVPEEGIPGLPASGRTFTADRALALRHDDVEFFSIDHPAVQTALDLALADSFGRTCFALARPPFPRGLYFDFHWIVDVAAKPEWNLQETVRPLHLQVVLDAKGAKADALVDALAVAPLKDGSRAQLARFGERLPSLLDQLERTAAKTAASRALAPMKKMKEEALRRLDAETRRLSWLRAGNEAAIGKRLEQLAARRKRYEEVFSDPNPRLDAVRIVFCA